MWKSKGTRGAKTILKMKNKVVEISLPNVDLFYSYNNQNSVILVEE